MSRAPAAWGVELSQWWSYYNELYLGRVLSPPVLRLGEATTQLGSWHQTTRTLTISAHHIEADPWLEVMRTLRHEMAHQYVDEHLRVTDEPPHGPAFRRACEVLRVDVEPAEEVADPEGTARIVRRIAKLLSLAGSPNENEAQASLAKARELLLRHNLDEVQVRGVRAMRSRWLGPVRGRHHHHEQILAAILAEFFFVNVLWTHTYDAKRRVGGTVLSVFGTPANLEMAEYVHAYLSSVADSLWTDYREREGLRGNRERLRFMAGVLDGFRRKLSRQDHELQEQHALVWRGDAALDDFVSYLHPRTRSGSCGGGRASKAFHDGVSEGKSVVLRKPLRGESGGFGGYLSG